MPRAIAIQASHAGPFSAGPLVFERGDGFLTDCGLLSAPELLALIASGEAAWLRWPVDVPEDTVGWRCGHMVLADATALLVADGALLCRVGDVLLVDPTKSVGVRAVLSNRAAWRSMIESARDSKEDALRWAEAAYALAPTMTPDLVALLSESLRAVGRVEDALALVQMEVNSKIL